MKSIRGDLIKLACEGKFDVIIHGCNCYCAMGKGIAKTIRDKLPEAYEADKQTPKGDASKLGTYSSAQLTRNEHTFTVVNGYTQVHWKGSGSKIDYNAMQKIFENVAIEFKGKRIGYPQIGAGLGGGDWNRISKIIDDALEGEDHTLVLFGR